MPLPAVYSSGGQTRVVGQKTPEEIEEEKRAAAEAQRTAISGFAGPAVQNPAGAPQLGAPTPIPGAVNPYQAKPGLPSGPLGGGPGTIPGAQNNFTPRNEFVTRDPLRDLRDKFLAERDQIPGTAPQLDRGRVDQSRGLMLDQVGQLQGIANGTTPSIADAQRRAAMLDSSQSILGTAAAGAPRLGAGSLRTAFRSLSDAGRRAGLDASLVKANEMSQARGQIGSLLGNVQTGDIQTGQLGLDSQLRSRGMDIDQSLGLGKLGLEAQTTESETRMREAQIQNLRDQIDFAYAKLAQEKDEGRRKMWMDFITSTVGALAGLGAVAAGKK